MLEQANAPHAPVSLNAFVNGTSNAKVTWTIQDDASPSNDSGADITSSGSGGTLSDTSSLTPMYMPPPAAGVYHLRAFNTDSWSGAKVNVLVSTVTVAPHHVKTTAGASQPITLTASLSNGTSAKWLIQDSGGKDVTASGAGGTLAVTSATTVAYTPPSTPGLFFVIATNNADTSAPMAATSGYAMVSVTTPASTDAPLGIVSPMLNWFQDDQPILGWGMLSDPAVPGTLYAFYGDWATDGGLTHVLQSTNSGLTWTQVDKASFRGNTWGVAIDPSPNRQKDSPPTMYAPAGYGNLGLWKSIDGGQTWKNLFFGLSNGVIPKKGGGTLTIPADSNGMHLDFYQVHVLPDDPPNHILVTYHYGQVLLESTDGGSTWELHSIPWGTSHYVLGVNATTWLILSQEGESQGGLFRTTTAGRDSGGAIGTSAWTKITAANSNAPGSSGGQIAMSLRHLHGSFTPWRDPSNGAIYLAGDAGVICSPDGGATWNSVFQGGGMSSVAGTDKYVYASGRGSKISRAPKSCAPQTAAQAPNPWTNTNWSSLGSPSDTLADTPPFGMVSVFNGAHWVINHLTYQNGSWRYEAGKPRRNADIWRYVEP